MHHPHKPFQFWFAFLVAYFCACACSFSAKAEGPSPDALRARVQALLAAEKIPYSSAAVLFIHEGETLLKEGFGYANLETKAPINEKTLFAIGSCTKAFTALGLKLLEQEGKLSLTDPVRKFLPAFSLLRSELSDQVSLEDLLAHRVSLPRHDLFWYLAGLNRYELIDRLPFLPFAKDESYQFRKRFVYNNLMYVTAGIVTEHVSGRTWEDFTRERILQPLGMTETGPRLDLSPEGSVAATPYVNGEAVDFNILENAAPAGSIYSNLNDMEKWVRFHLSRGETLMEESAWRDLFRERIGLELEGSPGVGYGLGWISFKRKGLGTVITHGGSIDGFSADVFFIPEIKMGVVVMINHGGSNELASNIRDALVTATLEKSSEPLPALTELVRDKDALSFSAIPDFSALTSNTSTSAPAAPSAELTGTYRHPAYGDLSIVREGDHWTYRFWRMKGPIRRTSEGTYTLEVILPIGQGTAPIEVVLKDGAPATIKVPFEPMSEWIPFEHVEM